MPFQSSGSLSHAWLSQCLLSSIETSRQHAQYVQHVVALHSVGDSSDIGISCFSSTLNKISSNMVELSENSIQIMDKGTLKRHNKLQALFLMGHKILVSLLKRTLFHFDTYNIHCTIDCMIFINVSILLLWISGESQVSLTYMHHWSTWSIHLFVACLTEFL